MKSRPFPVFIAGILFLISIVSISCSDLKNHALISLKGEWKFKTDSADLGETDQWFKASLAETIILPGSMRDNGFGDIPGLKTPWTATIYDSSWYFNPEMEKYRQKGNMKFPFWLTPDFHYLGPAWYQKTVEIPKSWSSKRIFLFLERPHWETIIWVDSTHAGMQNSLSTPHLYDLTELLTPGSHVITIRVDNRIKDIDPGRNSHSLSDQTQGNWNGIVGEINLIARSYVYIQDVKLYPDIKTKSVKSVVTLKNEGSNGSAGKIKLSANPGMNQRGHKTNPIDLKYSLRAGDTCQVVADYPMGDDFLSWDEFNPDIYKMTVSILDENGERDSKVVDFGMREFKTNGTRFEVNGRPVFLRGTVDCSVFPLTGYPPVDVASWDRVFAICKDHGLNHMRFHSYCPPEAAFIAADKAGIYLHVEGPSWANQGSTIGYGKPIDKYIYEESERIIDAYGNHPSFCMMAYGNEPSGRFQVEFLGMFVNYWKAKDSRHLYTSASIGMSWPLVPESEFIVRSGPRGLAWDNSRPGTVFDYSEKITDAKVPYLAHEMGQYCAFPNFREIDKYTGVLKARNFELFRENLGDHHMGDLAEEFLMASGKLQALCYKNEIEAALRTPGFAGFQLLSLNDFSGQGTALVGVLDAFWDEKPYINPEEFSNFCNSTVPLARIEKFTYTGGEVFKADLEIAHFGKTPLENPPVSWKILNTEDSAIYHGSFTIRHIPIGNCIPLGSVEAVLSNISKAQKLKLVLDVSGFQNDWEFWVYPDSLPQISLEDIHICHELDKQAEKILQNGGKVLLLAAGKVERGKEVVQYFKPVFWNTSWFKMRPPHTLGILCNPEHPLFKNFPTESHSNLQWWEVLNRQQVMILDDFPAEFRPVVQPIDTWFLNRRLGLVFEAKAGSGKLVVSSIDFSNASAEYPVLRQLYYSVISYMNSMDFNPADTLDLNMIKDIFLKKETKNFDFYTKEKAEDSKPKL